MLKVPIREDILKVCVAHEPYFYLYVRIEKDDYFVERDDLDLYTEADLSVGQAVLGGELKVRGLHQAEMYLDVEGGTGSHETLCRTEQGIARTHGGRKVGEVVRWFDHQVQNSGFILKVEDSASYQLGSTVAAVSAKQPVWNMSKMLFKISRLRG